MINEKQVFENLLINRLTEEIGGWNIKIQEKAKTENLIENIKQRLEN